MLIILLTSTTLTYLIIKSMYTPRNMGDEILLEIEDFDNN